VVASGLWWFSADQVARRALAPTPHCSIDEAEEGQVVRIVGRVEPQATLEAPLTGRRCVAWRVKVEEKRHRGNQSSWEA